MNLPKYVEKIAGQIGIGNQQESSASTSSVTGFLPCMVGEYVYVRVFKSSRYFPGHRGTLYI